MSKRFLTILILRDSGRTFRRVQISYTMLVSLAVIVVGLVVAGMSAPSLWFRVQTQGLTLEQLQHENRTLWNEQDYFDGVMAQMADRLDAHQGQAGRIARQLGIDKGDPAAGGGLDNPSLRRFMFEGELRYLQSRTEALDRSLEELDDVFQERERVLAATPNALPTSGWYSHGFGWRVDPFTSQRAFHRGIDIVADSGTDVLAPADGIVSRFGRYSDYGLSVDINHGNGYVTRYAHMKEAFVRAGDRMQRGDRIGLVGSTGRSTGPHLHYEVFRDGRRVNPWKYLGPEK